MTTEVDKAETTIATLEDKRKHLNQRAIELADERNKIAFGAHVENDAKARKRLDAINLELATMASEQSSVDAALVEAQSRLAIAKQAEARTADRVPTPKHCAAACQPSARDLNVFFWFGASRWKSKSFAHNCGRFCSIVFRAMVPLTRNCSLVGLAAPN